MRNSTRLGFGLLATTAMATVMGAQGAWAAEAAGSASDAIIEEVVVTATRQADTVNRVPLSISAVTQRNLDQQGIKSVADLQRTVPALNVSTGVSSGISNFSIRGVLATTGAPTTGVYLDEVPLQKRFSLNAAQANGTPAPVLFDLDRVEVLRGPQGTLFGGSSQGGTIRFITPAPSLTRYSVYARGEVSHINHGGESYEGGAAVGGPLVQDKLGFRISGFGRHQGGWIDFRDPYTNGSPVRFKDGNETKAYAFRGALLWAVSENTRVNASAYITRNDDVGFGNSTTVNGIEAFGTPEVCFLGNNPTTKLPQSVACTTPNAYHRPAASYGPYNNLGPYDSLTYRPSPYWTALQVYSLTLDHDFGSTMNAKLITSYLHDRSFGANANEAVTNSGTFVQWPVLNINNRNSFGRGLGLFRAAPDLATMLFKNDNRRKGLIEELRFSSINSDSRLTWVAGVYYSLINSSSFTIHGAAGNNTYADCERYSQLMFGTTCTLAFEPDIFPDGSMQLRSQRLRDIEIAAYGDVTYKVTDKLKLIGGVRVSRVTFDYLQYNSGNTPGHIEMTIENGGIIGGQTTEDPISPKISAQYQFTDNDMVYVTAAKGFRPGGVNPPITQSVCGAGLALVGLTSNDIPAGYGSDRVWSYELGAKTRLMNRFQVNASAYRIDWSDMQFTVSIPSCGPTFLQNIGKARIQGFDLQGQGRLGFGFTANVAMGYTHAEYITTAFGPKPLTGTPVPVVQKGDVLPVPPWQVTLGLQYDHDIGKHNAYIRGDWQYSSKYFRGLGPGVNSFNPETRQAASTSQINMRAGVNIGAWDINVFATNLFESRDVLAQGGGISGCALAAQPACPAPTSFNPLRSVTYQQPRTIGLQLAYRR